MSVIEQYDISYPIQYVINNNKLSCRKPKFSANIVNAMEYNQKSKSSKQYPGFEGHNNVHKIP